MTEAKGQRIFLPPNEITQFFWDAARAHRLEVLRCDGCGHYVHWPQPICPRCQSERLTPAEVSGRGAVYSYTVVEHVFNPLLAGAVPYSLAIVELEEQEGLRLLTNIVDCPHEELRIGMDVEVTFEDYENGSLPQFRPAGGAR